MHSQQGPTAESRRFPPADAAAPVDKRVEEALAALHRSVATRQFYPPNHPSLRDALHSGHLAWVAAEDDRRLSESGLRLRSGSLWIGSAAVGDANPSVLSLARVLGSHGIIGVVQRTSLSEEAFAQWVELLAAAPDSLLSQGGLIGAWKRTPHGTSLDLQRLTVSADRGAGEEKAGPVGGDWGQGLSAGSDLRALADPILLSRLKSFQQKGPKEQRVLDLLLRLGRTDDSADFQALLEEIARVAQECTDRERFRETLHIVLFLHREAQNMDALGKEGKRDRLRHTLRTLVRGTFLQWLIAFVVAEQRHEEAGIAEHVLRIVGKPAAVPLINALVLERDRAGRTRLIDVLVSIGEPVVPLVTRMLDDQRWFVVRNMVTILGGIATPDAVRALARLVRDPDGRIRREAVRAVGRVADPAAEDVVLAFLEDEDPTVRLMAVAAATAQRSLRVLQALWAMYERIAIRKPEWNVKGQIIQTVGRMGLPEAADRLEEVTCRRPMLWRRRWETLQVAATQALGELGGDKSRRLLETLLDHRSAEVRQAAVRALAVCGDERAGEDLCQLS